MQSKFMQRTHALPLIFLIVASQFMLSAKTVTAQGLIAIRGATIETVGKEGRIEDGTLLVRNGKIEAIAKDVEVPVSAHVIDGRGLTIMPGIVDPYYVVQVARSSAPASETRTVIVRGRSFNIGGGSPAVSTSFTKIADGISMSSQDWQVAARSGITSLHVVTGGYAQSLFAKLGQPSTAGIATAEIVDPNGKLLVTVSNDSRSLDIVRNGLKEPQGRGGGRGGPRGAPPASSAGSNTASSPAAGTTEGENPQTPPGTQGVNELWKQVREGKSHLFVNVNNAAAILHTLAAVNEVKNAKIAFIASGADVYVTLEALQPDNHMVILPPRIDTIPNSANLVNIPRSLAEKKISFAFSTSLAQSDFRTQQDTPLFSVGLLVRSGLDRKLALEALTSAPAKLLGLESKIGTLEVGKLANFMVLDGDPFATTTGIKKIYVDGKPIYEN